MDIITFADFEESNIDSKHNICYYESGCKDVDATILMLDIETIFDYEEKKHDATDKKYVSIAILDDEEDYEAFKNFGIDAWIHRADLETINQLLEISEKKLTA